MIKPMYTIFDRVSKTYWIPFCAHNDADAMRAIANAVNTPGDNDLFLHPEDFTIYKIALFNDQSNEPNVIEPIIPIDFIANCQSLMYDSSKKQEEK